MVSKILDCKYIAFFLTLKINKMNFHDFIVFVVLHVEII